MKVKIINNGKMWIADITYSTEGYGHRIESEDRDALMIVLKGLFSDEGKNLW